MHSEWQRCQKTFTRCSCCYSNKFRKSTEVNVCLFLNLSIFFIFYFHFFFLRINFFFQEEKSTFIFQHKISKKARSRRQIAKWRRWCNNQYFSSLYLTLRGASCPTANINTVHECASTHSQVWCNELWGCVMHELQTMADVYFIS